MQVGSQLANIALDVLLQQKEQKVPPSTAPDDATHGEASTSPQISCRSNDAAATAVQEDIDASRSASSMGAAADSTEHSNPQRLLQRSPNRPPQFCGFSDFVIPWGGLSGITMFVKSGSKAHEAILRKSPVEVLLPLYNATTMVYEDLSLQDEMFD